MAVAVKGQMAFTVPAMATACRRTPQRSRLRVQRCSGATVKLYLAGLDIYNKRNAVHR